MKYLLVIAALMTAGCGSSSTSPTAPPVTVPTVSGLTLSSSSDMMRIGAGETFTVTASRSDGTTIAVSGAIWSTDNAAVAVVNANGLVTPIGAGSSTVIVDYQGRRATKLIRVVPDLQGRWVGSWVKTGCNDQSGANVCASLTTGGLDMSFTQARDTVSGQVSIGSAAVTVTGGLNPAGVLTVSGSGLSNGFQTNIAAWTSTVSGNAMNGNFSFIITGVSFSGFVTLNASMSGVTKR